METGPNRLAADANGRLHWQRANLTVTGHGWTTTGAYARLGRLIVSSHWRVWPQRAETREDETTACEQPDLQRSMVLAHSRALKTGGNTLVVEADLREPEVILSRARGLLDFAEPVAILLVAVLHFVSDDDKPAEVIKSLLDAVPAGSWLVISHVTGEFNEDQAARSAAEYKQVTPGATVRSREQILAFFDGWNWLSRDSCECQSGGRSSQRSTASRMSGSSEEWVGKTPRSSGRDAGCGPGGADGGGTLVASAGLRAAISRLVAGVRPADEQEAADQADILRS
jgi:hypothetical protein